MKLLPLLVVVTSLCGVYGAPAKPYLGLEDRAVGTFNSIVETVSRIRNKTPSDPFTGSPTVPKSRRDNMDEAHVVLIERAKTKGDDGNGARAPIFKGDPAFHG